MYENRADRLSNSLRSNKISILSFFQFFCKINRNLIEIAVKATYHLHSNKYIEIPSLTFWGRNLITRRFGLHSNSRDVDEIRHLTISIDFCARKLYYYSCYCYFFMEYYELPSPPLFIRDWGFWKIIEKRIKIFL